MKITNLARSLFYLGPLFVLCFLFYCFGILNKRNYNIDGFIKESVSDKMKDSEMSENLQSVAEKVIFQSDCKAEMEKLNAEKVGQDDPRLVNLIRQFYLQPASVSPYNFTDDKRQDYSQGGQSTYVDTLLNHVENRFFVESGALDGERNSNSLLFEKHRQWTGLLVEPNPYSYKILQSRNRKSVSINACLSPYPYPAQIPMTLAVTPGHSKLNQDTNTPDKIKPGEEVRLVQCFPFYSILLASGRTNIDYFSLDIEGAELNVLKTIPWTNVDIKVIQIEYPQIKEGKEVLIDFMAFKGYTSLPIVKKPGREQDIIFVKNGSEYNKAAV